MPTVIRKVLGDKLKNHVELSADEWNLGPQFKAFEQWMREHRGDLDQNEEWIADIGFCVRSDPRGGGPVLSRELMQMCLEANLEIFLSEYPGDA